MTFKSLEGILIFRFLLKQLEKINTQNEQHLYKITLKVFLISKLAQKPVITFYKGKHFNSYSFKINFML